MSFTMKKSCQAVLLGLALTATTAPLHADSGFYAGVMGALDAGDMQIDNITSNLVYHVPVTGAEGGVVAGWEWRADAPKDAYHWTTALELSANTSNADYKRISDNITLRSYRVKDDRGVALLPGLEKDGTKYFARLGWVSSKLVHRDEGTAAQISPNFSTHKDGLVLGAGIENYIAPNWSWRAEFDRIKYNPIKGTSATPTVFSQRFRRNQFGMALTWHSMENAIGEQPAMPDGFHMGLMVGMNQMAANVYFLDGSSAVRDLYYNMTGPAGGLSIGYDWGLGEKCVLGFELDANYADSESRYKNGSTLKQHQNDGVALFSVQPGWHFTPNQLLYVEAGVAALHVTRQGAGANASSGHTPHYDDIRKAKELGVGYRTMVSDSSALTLKAQYFHTVKDLDHTVGAASFKTSWEGSQLMLGWSHYFSA